MQKASVHPNSRQAYQKSRIALRQHRLNEAKGVRDRARSAKGTCIVNSVDRIMSFVLLLSGDKTHIPDLNAFHDFINTFYLGRHDSELDELRAAQRLGRPKSKHLMELEEAVEKEKREYYEGIIVPDLMNETNVSLLRQWKGDPQALHLFRFVRVCGSDR